jgi:hypothetical protein
MEHAMALKQVSSRDSILLAIKLHSIPNFPHFLNSISVSLVLHLEIKLVNSGELRCNSFGRVEKLGLQSCHLYLGGFCPQS